MRRTGHETARRHRSRPDHRLVAPGIVITHFLNIFFMLLLTRSGPEVLSAFPKLYTGDDCTPRREWLRSSERNFCADSRRRCSPYRDGRTWDLAGTGTSCRSSSGPSPARSLHRPGLGRRLLEQPHPHPLVDLPRRRQGVRLLPELALPAAHRRPAVQRCTRAVVLRLRRQGRDRSCRALGHFYSTIPLCLARKPPNLLVREMNGRPVPVEHGAPIRLSLEMPLGLLAEEVDPARASMLGTILASSHLAPIAAAANIERQRNHNLGRRARALD